MLGQTLPSEQRIGSGSSSTASSASTSSATNLTDLSHRTAALEADTLELLPPDVIWAVLRPTGLRAEFTADTALFLPPLFVALPPGL